MSWYYVGPDARPVGPLALEELQARRSSGAIAPETYVIEAPPGSAPKEWRRYRDVFPPSPASFPPLPTGALPAQTSMPPTLGIPHPVFPAAAPAHPSPGGPVFTGTHPSSYRLPPGRSNPWCGWSLGLGIASVPLLLFCGLGILTALGGIVTGIVGLGQVARHRDQHGRGLAVTGIVVSVLALLLATGLIVALMTGSFRSGLQMTTEQTANDSDTR